MVDAAGHLAGFAPRLTAATPAAVTAADFEATPLSPAWLARYAAFAAAVPHGPAQEPVWLRAWSAHASPDVIAVSAVENGAPVMMLALEVVRRGPFRVARFAGGRHANANFPASAPAWKAAPADLDRLARAVRRARPDIDLVQFERMPLEESGRPNPLLAAGGAPSPNPALSLRLEGSMLDTLKHSGDRRKAKKHRSKIRKFEEAGGHRRIEATTVAEVERQLAAFFAFKEARFRAAGIANVFAEPAVRAALLALFTGALEEPHLPFLLHGLEVGGVLRAITGSSRTPERITCEFGAIRDDELSRQSPGEFLFYENIDEACRTGRSFYDFGVGDEPYKRYWCDTETTHFDVALALSLKGKALAGGLALLGRVKGAVKRNPAIWIAVKKLRRRALGAAPQDAAEAD